MNRKVIMIVLMLAAAGLALAACMHNDTAGAPTAPKEQAREKRFPTP